MYFSEKYMFDNNFFNFSLNINKFGMLIDNMEIDMSHDFGCYGNYVGGKLRITCLPKCVYL